MIVLLIDTEVDLVDSDSQTDSDSGGEVPDSD